MLHNSAEKQRHCLGKAENHEHTNLTTDYESKQENLNMVPNTQIITTQRSLNRINAFNICLKPNYS